MSPEHSGEPGVCSPGEEAGTCAGRWRARDPPCCGRSPSRRLRCRRVSVTLALTSDHVSEPGVHAALMGWITLTYVARRPGRVVAPTRQPLRAADGRRRASRSSSRACRSANAGGAVHDRDRLRPPPGRRCSCTCSSRSPAAACEPAFERVLVAAGVRRSRSALQLVGMALGGFGPDNVLAVVGRAGRGVHAAARPARRAQRAAASPASLSSCCGGAARAGRCAARSPCSSTPSRSALVMIAVLFLSAGVRLVSGQLAFEIAPARDASS